MRWLILFFSLAAFATPQRTIDILKELYPEQTPLFLQERINAAENPFELWRAFPAYYYYLASRTSLDQKEIGFCLGDGHFENFGVLGFDNPIFTLNDLDDASFCPLNLDLMRLYLSHQFIGSITDEDFFHAYSQGLQRDFKNVPALILSEKEKSKEKGRVLPKKMKALWESQVCQGEYENISPADSKWIASVRIDFSFACKRLKIKGGSGGNERFVVFYQDEKNLQAFELKKLSIPAPLREKKLSIADRKKIIEEALPFFFGADSRIYYSVIQKEDQLFLKRPLWASHRDLNLNDLKMSDKKEISLFEVRLMGYFHSFYRKTFSMPLNWSDSAKEISSNWRQSF